MASSNSSEPELSRQEAIKVLEMFLYKQCSLGRTEFAYDADTVWKAVKMAAESLKTDEAYNLLYEETTKKDLEVEAEDCISRADAIKLLENYGSVEITNKLKALPTVYPKSDIDEDIYKASLNLQATALNDLWNTNKQLKKELEMLKLDRECDKPSGEWIPTSETMPDNPSEDVLVCDIDGDIYKAYLSDYDGWKRSEDFEKVKNVVAWQPLPPAYKMESEDRK